LEQQVKFANVNGRFTLAKGSRTGIDVGRACHDEELSDPRVALSTVIGVGTMRHEMVSRQPVSIETLAADR
jgi:hypothetical protein